MVGINSISVLISIFIKSNYIGQCKHTPVVAILLVSIVEEIVVGTISVLISIFFKMKIVLHIILLTCLLSL